MRNEIPHKNGWLLAHLRHLRLITFTHDVTAALCEMNANLIRSAFTRRSTSDETTKTCQSGQEGKYWRIHISVDEQLCPVIPVKLDRKRFDASTECGASYRRARSGRWPAPGGANSNKMCNPKLSLVCVLK